MTKLQRMQKHVLESLLERGVDLDVAEEIASRTVNKHRAKLARGKRVCKKKHGRTTCKTVRGPKLVTRGGSRNQWWPGKKGNGKRKFYCLTHKRKFKNKAGLSSHYRSKAHKPCCDGCAKTGGRCGGKKKGRMR